MKKIIKYEAFDGQLFETLVEVQNYEKTKLRDHRRWYGQNELMDSSKGSIIKWDDFFPWVLENTSELAGLLGSIIIEGRIK